MNVLWGMIKVYRPLSSEINFPKLTSTTLGFPGKTPLSADPGSGDNKSHQLRSFGSCDERRSPDGMTDYL